MTKLWNGDTIKECEAAVDKVVQPKPITGSELFRFLNEGRPDEFDHDGQAEWSEDEL